MRWTWPNGVLEAHKGISEWAAAARLTQKSRNTRLPGDGPNYIQVRRETDRATALLEENSRQSAQPSRRGHRHGFVQHAQRHRIYTNNPRKTPKRSTVQKLPRQRNPTRNATKKSQQVHTHSSGSEQTSGKEQSHHRGVGSHAQARNHLSHTTTTTTKRLLITVPKNSSLTERAELSTQSYAHNHHDQRQRSFSSYLGKHRSHGPGQAAVQGRDHELHRRQGSHCDRSAVFLVFDCSIFQAKGRHRFRFLSANATPLCIEMRRVLAHSRQTPTHISKDPQNFTVRSACKMVAVGRGASKTRRRRPSLLVERSKALAFGLNRCHF